MLRTTFKTILILLIAAVTMTVGILATAWFFPNAVFSGARFLFPKTVGDRITVGDIEGNPYGGYRFDDLSLHFPSFRATVPTLTVAFSWDRLLNGRFWITEARLTSPEVVVKEMESDQQASTETAHGGRPWAIGAEHIVIENGRFMPPPSVAGTIGTVDHINANLSFQEGTIRASSTSLRVLDSTVSIRGTASLRPIELDLEGSINGAINGRYDFSGTTTSTRVSLEVTSSLLDIPLIGDATGQVEITFTASGAWPEFNWELAGGAVDLAWRELRLKSVRVSAKGRGIPPRNTHGSVVVNEFETGPLSINRFAMLVDGSLPHHRIQVDVRSGEKSLSASLNGTFRNKRWAATWQDVGLDAFETWATTAPFRTVVNPPEFHVSGLSLIAEDTIVQFSGNLNKKIWNPLSFRLVNFNLARLRDYEMTTLELGGVATIRATVRGELRSPRSAQASIHVSSASLKGKPIGEVSASARINEDRLIVEKGMIRNSSGTVYIEARVPLKTPDQFSLDLQTEQFDLTSVINGITDNTVDNFLLSADLTVDKHDGRFLADGPARATSDRLEIPPLGISLRDVHLAVNGNGDVLKIKEGLAHGAEEGTLRVDGLLSQQSPALSLQAERIAFSLPMGLDGHIDADLTIGDSWTAPHFEGEIRVREADFNPEKRKESPKRPESKEKAPSALRMNLGVAFDRNVWYKQKQTSIELKGQLSLRKESFEPIRIFGTIEAVRGSYVLYGRVFKIDSAIVTFSGHAPPNPILNIKAAYVEPNGQIRVYLVVTGTKDQPVISLTSEPPLEESDIVSVLVTGRPLYELGQGGDGTDSTQLAQNVVAGYLSEEIRQQIQDTIDLDVFRINVTEEELTDVVIGKNVTEDLFVSYGQTLGPAGEQRIEAEYYLTQRWNLEGYTTSTGRYVIDLLFKFGFQ